MKPVTFELSEEAIAAVDEIAENLGESRDHVLREGVALYLAGYEDEKTLIAEADRQFEAGETLSHEEVMAKFHAWKTNIVREAA